VVHIFVSYSRRDSELVGRIVDRIESSGHEVWIDTDDIVGSDRWRSSVAEAIVTADVVVLMVSPASMSSRSVEREITLAAEEDRRIIPVEIEPADVAVGLQYDLAGIQRITFVDRPLDDGVADLLAAINDAPTMLSRPRARTAPRSAPRAPTPPSARRRSARAARPWRWVRWTVAAAVVTGLAVVGAKLRSDDDTSADAAPGTGTADTTDTADIDTEATTTALTATTPALTDVPLDATVWFAGYTIHASHARLDPAGGTVTVDVQFTNDQDDNGSPCPFLFDDIALVVGGQRAMLWADRCPDLSPGTSTRTTLDAELGPEALEGLDLGDAAVALGGPEQHRANIPLDGRPPTSGSPSQHSLSGSLSGEVTSFVVEHVEVVPASCSSWSPLTFPPGRADEMAVIVTGTATSTYPYQLNYGKYRLTLPDGTQLASNNGPSHLLDPGVPERDVRACFLVPTPIAGEYRFTAAADGNEPFPEPITFAL
jgi:hypothetical protein